MKKIFVQFLILLMILGSFGIKVSAEGELLLPKISSIGNSIPYTFLPNGDNFLAAIQNGTSIDTGIVQVSTGNMVKKLTSSYQGFISGTAMVNDKGKYYATTDHYGKLTIFNDFGERIFSSNTIKQEK